MSKVIRNSKVEGAIINSLKQRDINATKVELYTDGSFSVEYDYSMTYREFWAEKMTLDQARDLQDCHISYRDTGMSSMEGIQYAFSGSKKAFEAAQNMGYFYEMNPSECKVKPDIDPYNNLGDRILDDLSETLGIACGMVESGFGYFVCEIDEID